MDTETLKTFLLLANTKISAGQPKSCSYHNLPSRRGLNRLKRNSTRPLFVRNKNLCGTDSPMEKYLSTMQRASAIWIWNQKSPRCIRQIHVPSVNRGSGNHLAVYGLLKIPYAHRKISQHLIQRMFCIPTIS